MNREEIFAAISKERNRQDGLWGTDFDDKSTINDWVTYIVRYASSSVKMDMGIEYFKEQILKAAALCVAALEAMDRLDDQPPKRHYDE